MPSTSPSQRIAEISEALEVLRTQSLNHLDKAAEILSNAIGLRRVSSEWLTALAGRGHNRSRAGCSAEIVGRFS
jgi:hypothetical protein